MVILAGLEAFLGSLGGLLGASCAVLERSWVVLGRSWVVMGWSWGHLGSILGHLGRAWSHLGTTLGRLEEPKTLIFLMFFKGQAQHGLQLGPPRAKMARTSRAELGVRNSPADPPDPADQVSGGAVQNLPSSRAGGQDDGSLHKLPQISLREFV